MIYLSAQPDELYFVWQLEIQLRNFKLLNIKRENIQVLIAYNKERGVSPRFQEFIDLNCDLAQIYCYPDLRVKPKYMSSIRPHILQQHFELFPELEKETIFYHDSDILFSRVLQIEEIMINDNCYVSDTRNYLDVNYIRRNGSEDLLDNMLEIVGLDKDKLLLEDSQTGGAQYILKCINSDFWKKVEKDCESLYVVMHEYNKTIWETEYSVNKIMRHSSKGIQAWCADMWAVLWNLWLDDRKVEIHSEMNFSWPFSSIIYWEKYAIQHYSGQISDKTKYFKKTEYLNYMPWYDHSLDSISNISCSYEIVRKIKMRKDELDQERPIYVDSIILCNVLNDVDLINFKIFSTYINKYINIPVKLISQNNALHSLEFNRQSFYEFKEFEKFLIISSQNLLSVNNILKILNSRINLLFQPKNAFNVDSLFKEAFSKMLELELLIENKGKLNVNTLSESILWLDRGQCENILFHKRTLMKLDTVSIDEFYCLK
ncbi:hypothetical protein [Sphingobacterium sp. JUb56]|uniref:hypothetical protein n=1 Tax=Sphingobacterium sp. JUb56 TaxID=2587145 RepID=UPI00160EC53E|nr:hypothetical protein [Sphingobacterium sp. JUb56]MBB2951296.1 hypothetical protein [Sphingobacterium sp. JUb56]